MHYLQRDIRKTLVKEKKIHRQGFAAVSELARDENHEQYILDTKIASNIMQMTIKKSMKKKIKR